MAGLNFSISEEPRVPIEFEGWPGEQKVAMLERSARIDGVTNVAAAGGMIGAYVYYDRQVVTAHRLIEQLRAIATDLMPGRSW